MRFSILYLNLVYFGVRLSIADRIKPELYIPLIKHMRSYCFTSAVILVEPCRDDKFFDVFDSKYVTHVWTSMLGRSNIASLTVSHSQMHLLSRYYENTVRPMIIVVIPGPHSFNQFSNITRTFKMSFPAWLVMFMPYPRNNLTTVDYCHEPVGNPFHLSFNTEMFVMCPGDDTVYEWYSIDGQRTEIFKIAKWDINTPGDFKLFTTASLYERRNDLKGIVLRGVLVPSSTLLTIHNNEIGGFLGNIVGELERALNFTVKPVARHTEYGSFNTTTKRWGGAMGIIVSGKADIGIGDFSMINDRLNYVDFSTPIMTVRQSMYFKEPEIFAVKWSAYYKAFSFAVWVATFLTGFVTLIVTTFIICKLCSCPALEVIHKECLRIWGILCLQGMTDFPRNSSLRLAYISLFVASIVANAGYSASLICFLTAHIRDVPFRSLDEFIKDGTYSVITSRGSANYDIIVRSGDSVSKTITKLMKPKEDLPLFPQDGFNEICNNDKLGFYIGFSTDMQRKSQSIYMPCNLLSIYDGRVDSLAMVLSKDNQFTTVLNYHLQKLLSSGVLNRDKYETGFKRDTGYQPVSFGSIISVLMIFILGTAIALLVLAGEVCYNKYRHRERSDHQSIEQ
ncbi:putative glutamate receptor [Lasioglossum baleicum]|uniref:putative glutamate receptor n=1 Tax=Lasioglossum baleicum TaxID=434251 RepID=UPI003FCE9FCD